MEHISFDLEDYVMSILAPSKHRKTSVLVLPQELLFQVAWDLGLDGRIKDLYNLALAHSAFRNVAQEVIMRSPVISPPNLWRAVDMLQRNPKHRENITKLAIIAPEELRVTHQAPKEKSLDTYRLQQEVVDTMIYSSLGNKERLEKLSGMEGARCFENGCTQVLFSLIHDLQELTVSNIVLNTNSPLRGLLVRNEHHWQIENQCLGELRKTLRVIEVEQSKELPPHYVSRYVLTTLRDFRILHTLMVAADLLIYRTASNIPPRQYVYRTEQGYVLPPNLQILRMYVDVSN